MRYIYAWVLRRLMAEFLDPGLALPAIYVVMLSITGMLLS